MSWIATVEDDNTEIGCVWATAIDAIAVTEIGDERWAVEISGGSWTFLAGVFASERVCQRLAASARAAHRHRTRGQDRQRHEPDQRARPGE